MAKITMEIESRALYVSNDERGVAELFELTGMCEYADDAESDNDFDVAVRSDLDRYTTSVACDTAETAQSDQREAAITGTRTSATEFTRTAGTWTASTASVLGLKGYRAWIYTDTAPDAGAWYDVLSNTTTKITVESGTIPAGCNRVQLQCRYKIRHHLQLTPRCDFYGSFFQYKVTKKISSFDGKFKWFGVRGSAIPRNVDPEFKAGFTAITNGW